MNCLLEPFPKLKTFLKHEIHRKKKVPTVKEKWILISCDPRNVRFDSIRTLDQLEMTIALVANPEPSPVRY